MKIKNYFWTIFNKLQCLPICPRSLRTKLLISINMQLDKTASIVENVYFGSSNLVMGVNTFVNVGGFLDGCSPVIIEDYVRIGPYVKILTGTHNYMKSVIRRSNDEIIAKGVIIKRGYRISMGAIIMPGVTIGEGCIVAAGAVVIKNTEPNGLYAGNPAKRVKDLPVEEQEVKVEII